MAQLSLGLIEVIGLAAAIEAADAAVKSANVVLVGYELTKGDGMIVVKFEGDVGAVNAAVAAAAVAAARVNRVIATRVIARPAAGIAAMVASAATVGVQRETAPVAAPVPAAESTPAAAPVVERIEQAAAAAPAEASAAQIGSDEERTRSPDAGEKATGAEQSVPSSSRQAKTGGRSTAGNSAKHRNRHGA